MFEDIVFSRNASALDLAGKRALSAKPAGTVPADADGLKQLTSRWKESRDYSTPVNRDREATRARHLIDDEMNAKLSTPVRSAHVKAILSGLKEPAHEAETLDIRGKTATNLAGALGKGHLPQELEPEVNQALRLKYDGTAQPHISPKWQEEVAARSAAAVAGGKTHLDTTAQTKTIEAVLDRGKQPWLDSDARERAISASYMIPAEHTVDPAMMDAVGNKTKEILSNKTGNIPNDSYATVAKHASTALQMKLFPEEVRGDVADSLVDSLPNVQKAGAQHYSHVARMISDAAISGAAPNMKAGTIRDLSQDRTLSAKDRSSLTRNADLREYQTNPTIQNFLKQDKQQAADELNRHLHALNADPTAKNLLLKTAPQESLQQLADQARTKAINYKKIGDEAASTQWSSFSSQLSNEVQSRNSWLSSSFHGVVGKLTGLLGFG